MPYTIPEGSAVYIIYRESGLSKALADIPERETLGWLQNITKKDIYIQHNRTVDRFPNSCGSANGIRIPIKSIRAVWIVDKREHE